MRPWIFNGGTLVGDEIYGVQRNALEMLKELDALVSDRKVELVVPAGGVRTFDFAHIAVVELSKTSRFTWNHWVFPRYVRSTAGLGIDLLLALPLWGCDVVEIYDCIAELFPENAASVREKLARAFYLLRVRNSLLRSRTIITDSRSSKEDLVQLYGCDARRIEVVPCGWQHVREVKADYRILQRLGLSEASFFFSLGSRYHHKNFRWVVEAARQNPFYSFVVSGSERLNTSDKGLAASVPSNLVFAGYLSDAEVKALMERCRAFIQPSLYEGFGIPPLEAMSCGADCIVAQTSSLPEVYGPSVWYIDPTNYEGIDLDAIMREPKGDAASCLAQYSWAKSARQLLAILSSLD